MKDLSVIILSYNTEKITIACLNALGNCLSKSPHISARIILIDNASVDGSTAAIESYVTNNKSNVEYTFIKNNENYGFVKGNNQGLKYADSRYVLFLNSDVIMGEVMFDDLIRYMDQNKKVGVITVRVNLPDGNIDKASHRGFPTPWNSFCYFIKLEALLGKFPYLGVIFGGYHLTHLNLGSMHEIDSPTGAFYLTRKEILNNLRGFDEDYFMYGEDIDLSYRIKKAGYSIVYYPKYSVTHLKYSSGIQTGNKNTRLKTRTYFYDSMKIFYKKHYSKTYPELFNRLIYMAIDLKKIFSK